MATLTVQVLLLGLMTTALGMPLNPEKHHRTFPIVTMQNFHATMITTVLHFGTPANPPPPNTTTTSVIAGDKTKLVLSQFDLMPDGRYGGSILDFTHSPGTPTAGVMYQVTPFFNETICYKLPVSQGPSVSDEASKPSAAQKAWRDQLFTMLQLTTSPQLDNWKKNGTKIVDGKTCTVWLDPEGTGCQQTVCFDDSGNVHSSVFKQMSDKRDGFWQEITLKDFRPATAAEVTPPTGCVDLLRPTINVDLEHTTVNDAGLIRKANEEAAGVWKASASPVFEGMSLAQAQERHGTVIAMPNLPLGVTNSELGATVIPSSFDARQAWTKCHSISRIRNQGQCGSCWAFAATEVLADRICIAGGSSNFTGSVEYMIDCDKNDSGCEGGLLDDAWDFLKNVGVPEEHCDPYKHCPNPASPQCKPKDLVQDSHDPAPPKCPAKCSDGSPLKNIKAKSAYMVSKPGDVKSMQQEIMTNGPLEVAFFVYSDFQTYQSGVYRRTKSSQGPLGGHAVRVLGWGTEKDLDYWLVANSWSPGWGENGYFKIQRGTNECGIETIPVAGLV